ncbi:MAG: DUF2939 domain-containing protein [Desulfobulbaceae bacterium]|nr:DUF2939 domain-containing protein [Desulfobulbaceae bacterium]
MKSIFNLIFTIFLVFVGYIALAPFLTEKNISMALEQYDAVSLRENVDYPALKQNLTEQFRARMKDKAPAISKNPLGALAYGLASGLIEEMVDSYMTPEGIAQLIRGDAPLSGSNVQRGGKDGGDLFAEVRHSYDSHNKFSIWVTTDQQQEVRVVLTRKDFSWKLTNIILPPPSQRRFSL